MGRVDIHKTMGKALFAWVSLTFMSFFRAVSIISIYSGSYTRGRYMYQCDRDLLVLLFGLGRARTDHLIR